MGETSMADFGMRFFLSNIFICVIISILFLAKYALKRYLTSRMQFHLWLLLLGMLIVPFLPVRPIRFSQIFLLLDNFKNAGVPGMEAAAETALNINVPGTAKQINDFALSVSSKTPSVIGLILFAIWLGGIFVMAVSAARSSFRLNILKKSALPLQNQNIRMLYRSCLDDLNIKKNIPIYSTVFLKSPIITGVLKPCIYLPIHLISDFHMTDDGGFDAADMRYILLHELQHYKHKDPLVSCLMSLTGILYWFNPFVRYALGEMQGDREAACDASVLKLLDERNYADYGNTLINFAEKVSHTPFPFTAGISGSMKQMKKRIIRISSYKRPSVMGKIKGFTAFGTVAVLLLGLTPMLSTYAGEQNYYQWNISPEKVSLVDLSAYFGEYQGSFVLYDSECDTWSIYDMDYATLRTSPDSTYKIYDALFGLEEEIITPKASLLTWDGTDYPFEAWNRNQDLYSAMESSVNWYFQKIDEQLGASAIQNYVEKIGYGNENIHGDPSFFWMQSTLKISPVEQVELLTDLYNNSFGFNTENIDAVKNSICLFSDDISFYGKTGTGRIDGKDVNGWFIGFVETGSNTYFFATNIQNNTNATGSNAAEITKSILRDLYIGK